jgi:hypothetical protein
VSSAGRNTNDTRLKQIHLGFVLTPARWNTGRRTTSSYPVKSTAVGRVETRIPEKVLSNATVALASGVGVVAENKMMGTPLLRCTTSFREEQAGRMN